MNKLNYRNKRKKVKDLNIKDRELIGYYIRNCRPKKPSRMSLTKLIGAYESTIRHEFKRGKVWLVNS